MAAFSNKKNFDARAYLSNRPQYSPEYASLIFAWHEASGNPHWDAALDLGCGPGQMTYQLIQKFKNVTGVDPSEVMLAAAQDEAVPDTLGLKLPQGHTLAFKQAKAESTALPSESFDLISAATAAHWFPWKEDPDGEGPGKMVWKEMARLLKPGGTLVFGGYTNLAIKGHDIITRHLEDFVFSQSGFGRYFELSEDLSPTLINMSYYKTMPKPTEPEFDSSQTETLIFAARHQAAPALTTDADVNPIPAWARKRLSTEQLSGPEQAVVTSKSTLRGVALFIRSTSAWPKYVDEHPEEKELEAQEKDLPFRLLEEWRQDEAKQTDQKPVDWDEELDLYYPAVMLFARKR